MNRIILAALKDLSKNEIKLIKALDENHGRTSEEISQEMGWKGQSFHTHLGFFCQRRLASYLEAPPSVNGEEPFWSGIIADGANEHGRWVWRGIKPGV